ncbi:MAG: 4Fe-4S dicluster domain-containing protein [Candidatus Aminicenantes bacterium]|jgi:sulfhydrogenase subunit beta (sulfur reductase)
MKIVKLKKENLFPFLESISNDADLWAPVKKYSDKHVFQIVEDLSLIDLDYTRTLLPPRNIILPPEIDMFTAEGTEYRPNFSHVAKRILFGIHPCDIHGLLIMDKFYAQTYEDPYYLRSRENTIILGHSCWPDEHCLCRSTNTHIVEEGYDLFFTDLNEHYLVWIGSSRGDDLIRVRPDLFEEEISEKDIQCFIQRQEEKEEAFQAEINFKAMPDLMELKYNDPLWEELGTACLACGSCTNVCPTCNCYNVEDRPVLGKTCSNISRCWDACTLENYSGVAGGENFREKRANRLKLWYTHKLQAYISKYGKPACVGCGRCVVTCPVDINVLTVGKTLGGNGIDSFWKRLSKEVAK